MTSLPNFLTISLADAPVTSSGASVPGLGLLRPKNYNTSHDPRVCEQTIPPVMHFFKTEHIFDHNWKDVSRANWRKYPNEITTHVISVDTIRREIDSQGRLVSERLICIQQSVPKFVSAIIGSQTSYAREVSVVDPKSQTLVLRTVNLTANNLLKVFEDVTYTPDRNDPTKTYFVQTATINAFLKWQRLCNQLEKFSLERFQANASLGKDAFDSVLNKLFGQNGETPHAA